MNRDDFGFDADGCIVQCPVCGLIYQVDGTAGTDRWCTAITDPSAVRCPNCGSPLKNGKGFGRKGWGQRRRFRGHNKEGLQGREQGCKGLDRMEGMALRRRAIVAILILRLTGRRGWVDPYYIQALEASLSTKEIDRICTALGHPRYCPGGKPIPMGECCKAGLVAERPVILPLSAMREGQSGKILLVRDVDSNHLDYLGKLGLLPGIRITVESASPAFVLRVDDFQVAMETGMARNIYLLVD